jgi:alkylation response protein AidB-like acyl-CoA dehydrogenase
MLPIRQDGVEVHRIEMLNGNKEFCQEFLSDVRVPDADRIGEVDDGWTVGTRWMFHERMLFNSPLVTFPVGTMRTGDESLLALARDAGRDRDPIARDLIGEARALELTGDALRRRIAQGVTTGTMTQQASAIARLWGGVAHTRRATIALELAGDIGGAWSADDGAATIAADDFLMRQVSCIGGGTTEMARNVISERVLGMPRERTLDRDVPFRDVPRSAPST